MINALLPIPPKILRYSNSKSTLVFYHPWGCVDKEIVFKTNNSYLILLWMQILSFSENKNKFLKLIMSFCYLKKYKIKILINYIRRWEQQNCFPKQFSFSRLEPRNFQFLWPRKPWVKVIIKCNLANFNCLYIVKC